MPVFSRMNNRFVSWGGDAMQTGWVKATVGNALLIVKPNCGGFGGRVSDVFGPRCNCAFVASAKNVNAQPIAGRKLKTISFIVSDFK